jgi:hypothetical protein
MFTINQALYIMARPVRWKDAHSDQSREGYSKAIEIEPDIDYRLSTIDEEAMKTTENP